MNKAIVIGTDGMNALGLVQSLGMEGIYVIALLECGKYGLIRHSKFIGEIIQIKNVDEAIDILLTNSFSESTIPVFPAGDGAAMALDNNYERLKERYKFEHAAGQYNIGQLMNKEIQVELANKHKFNVPYSACLRRPFIVPENMKYPCIVKPMVSCLGDKRDILIAVDRYELEEILSKKISYSDAVIIQQFIRRDYEYNMIGCSFKNGEILTPIALRPVKFNRFLQNSSTVNYIEPVNDEIGPEIIKLRALMQEIHYFGLFSAEFMHSIDDDKVYFIEINFRNDGLNAFIVHGGVNLPYLHYQDLFDQPRKKYEIKIKVPVKYMWEGIHFSGLIHHQYSFWEWMKDLRHVKHFLYYFKEDKAPFYYQFINKLLSFIVK